MHIPALAETDGVREVSAPSTQTFPPGYLLVTVGPEGTTVRLVVMAERTELRRIHRRRREKSATPRYLRTWPRSGWRGFHSPVVGRLPVNLFFTTSIPVMYFD